MEKNDLTALCKSDENVLKRNYHSEIWPTSMPVVSELLSSPCEVWNWLASPLEEEESWVISVYSGGVTSVTRHSPLSLCAGWTAHSQNSSKVPAFLGGKVVRSRFFLPFFHFPCSWPSWKMGGSFFSCVFTPWKIKIGVDLRGFLSIRYHQQTSLFTIVSTE